MWLLLVFFSSSAAYSYSSKSILSRQNNIFIQKLNSNDDDYYEALEIAKQYDAEWLSKILDYNTISNYSSIPIPEKNARDGFAPNKLENLEELLLLGYEIEDIKRIKTSVKNVILAKSVKRPKIMPKEWLITSKSPPVSTKSTRSPALGINDENLSRVIRGNAPMRTGIENEVFEVITNEEDETAAELKRRYYASKAKKSSQFSREPRMREELLDESDLEIDSEVDQQLFQENGSGTFWPDTEEFKEMLLDESKWRIDLVGPWSASLVREETKWRYDLYKKWLRFLDEGLGDGFDVLPNEFDASGEYGEEDNYEDETEEDEFREISKPKVKQSSPYSGSSGRVVPKKAKNVEERGSMKAANYETWLKTKLEDEEEWMDKTKVERMERRSISKAVPSVGNKEAWFEDTVESPSKSPPQSRTIAKRDSLKKKKSREDFERLEDLDEV